MRKAVKLKKYIFLICLSISTFYFTSCDRINYLEIYNKNNDSVLVYGIDKGAVKIFDESQSILSYQENHKDYIILKRGDTLTLEPFFINELRESKIPIDTLIIATQKDTLIQLYNKKDIELEFQKGYSLLGIYRIDI